LTDFAKQVSGTTGAPLTIASDAEADAWTSILLTKKAPTFDAGKAAAGLAQLKSFPINHYGSHTLKLPDANMESDQPGFFAMETPDKVLGVVGVAFTKRKFSGIGNAEKSPHHRVISAIYRDGETGEVVSVLDDLLRGGRVTQSMRRLSSSGRNTDACQEIIEAAHAINARRNAGCDVDELSSENKVILWPMADGDYLALTPTTNMALLMETKERIDTRKDANDLVFFPDRAIKILRRFVQRYCICAASTRS
jgi:hypothetical protein